jgi:hypothetical protein
MRWTEEKLLEYQARNKSFKSDDKPDEENECELDRKIYKYCKDIGYYAFHDYSRGINKSGHLDWVIALPNGRTVWIENKSKNGKLSTEQKLNIIKLSGLNHEVYECRSYKKFLEIINAKPK